MQLEYIKRLIVSFSLSQPTHTGTTILKLHFSFDIVVTVCVGWDKLNETTKLLVYSSYFGDKCLKVYIKAQGDSKRQTGKQKQLVKNKHAKPLIFSNLKIFFNWTE